MPHLALYTFGVLKAPLADPGESTRDFHRNVEVVYGRIGQYPGYVTHAETAESRTKGLFDAEWGAWGRFAVPRWYDKGRTPMTTALAATYSLWTDLPSAFEAVYTGVHRDALNRRYDWFERTEHPGYVLWWVPEGETPVWQDGVTRLEHLYDHGSAPHAFTFRRPFSPDGTAAEGVSTPGHGR
jgi:hypothetical protein